MRLILGVFAALAVLSLLALGLVLLLLALLRALVTGQRPAVVTAFSRFRQFSGQQMTARWPARPRNAAQGPEESQLRPVGRRAPAAVVNDDVVDVEVREIPAQGPPR